MGFIAKFEDILAWQEARKLTAAVYRMTGSGPFTHDFGLRDQIQRASVSSMSNIAEGFDCESRAEFGRFLGIARRSSVEVQSLLYVALDVPYIDIVEFERQYEQARKTKALIGGLKRSLVR
jgi:four helix bundle protein